MENDGDVLWKPSEAAKDIPIFECESFEVFNPNHNCTVIQFGPHRGHAIEFKVEEMDPPGTLNPVEMTLKNDLWCCLRCKRMPPEVLEPLLDTPFTLLPALVNGYFADLTITASSGTEFAVHSSILALAIPEVDWKQTVSPLSGLSENVLATILCYIYSECLPTALPPIIDDEIAHQVTSTVSQFSSPVCVKLIEVSERFRKHQAWKKEIINQIKDLHACLNQITEHLTSAKAGALQDPDNLKGDPAKLCYILKQCGRDCAVAIGKFVVLCQLVTSQRKELKPDEKLDIMNYARSRIPIFLKQIHQIFKALKTTFYGMTPTQKFDVATYVVPEVESVLDTFSAMALDLKTAMEQIINGMCPHVHLHPLYTQNTKSESAESTEGISEPQSTAEDVLSKDILTSSLNTILTLKEISLLRRFHQWMTYSLAWLLQRRENLNEMSSVNKVRSVARNLDQMMEEIPVVFLHLHEIDENVDWREFKFVYKLAASKVASCVDLMVTNKKLLQDVYDQVSNFVQREEFNKCMVTLGMLDPCKLTSLNQFSENTESYSPPQYQTAAPTSEEEMMDLCQSLCVSPSPRTSYLATQILGLLHSGQECDMVFEIITPKDAEHSGDQAAATVFTDGSEAKQEIVAIKAHRVIVATRCDWFRKALLSGMRESIDRKILVHDTNPSLFYVFLEYLYSGRINIKDLNVDQWAELMMLSDRYEVDTLKQVCEQVLKDNLDNDSVLYFLSLADQFNAKALKDACLTFASHNPEVMDHDLFAELPQSLQAEVYDLIIWVKPLAAEPPPPPPPPPPSTEYTSPELSGDSSLEDLADLMANLRGGGRNANRSITDSMEEVPAMQDASQLERCVQELLDIVGESACRHHLAQLVLAADYDVNRAANFYYEQSNNHP